MSNSGKNRGLKAFLVILAIVVLVAAGGYFVYLPGQYNEAIGKKETGKYTEAIAIFSNLTSLNYKDSKSQIDDCNRLILQGQYDAAVALLAEEKYEEAIKAFTALGDFSDSKNQIISAQEAINQRDYNAAKALAEDGKYEDAIKAFALLNGYGDSTAQIEAANEAINQIAYDKAKQLFADGKFEEAVEAFIALNGFSDSTEQIATIKEAINERDYEAAKQLLETAEYEKAIEAFTALNGFKDSAEQIVVAQNAIKQNEYNAAKVLLDAEKYEEAIDAFLALGDFGDSAEQIDAAQTAIKQQKYDAAKSLLDAGKYEEAIEAFSALDGFSDSLDQIKIAKDAISENAYQAAMTLLENSQYQAAADAFDALGEYKDSVKQSIIAQSKIPRIILSEAEINTEVAKKVTVVATAYNIESMDRIDIKAETLPPQSITINGLSYTATGVPVVELVNKSIQDNVITLEFEGGIITGSQTFSFIVNEEQETKYCDLRVNNKGIPSNGFGDALKVNYIGDRGFFLYDDANSYVLNFSLKDSSQTNIKAPALVDIRIENSEGAIVYNQKRYITPADFGTWTSAFYGSRLMAGIYISPEDIIEGTSTTGTVYFTVELPGLFNFGESQVSASELPTYDATKDCSLEAPSMPLTLSYRSSSKVQLTGFNYEFSKRNNGNVDLKLTFEGNKTYDSNGSNHSGACYIGYKLYDPEGFVLKSGTISTASVAEGEKFRNAEITFNNIVPGAYKLVLIDVD